MGYYPVVSLRRAVTRHLQGVPHNTCGQLRNISAWNFDMVWHEHATLNEAINGRNSFGPTCKACIRNAKRAMEQGTI